MHVSTVGHGNDKVWKAWKAKKPAFHPSHTFWKSLWDSHIPTTSTAGVYLKTPQWVALHLLGLFSLSWFEKIFRCHQLNIVMGCRRVDTVVLFAGGYLTTVFLALAVTYGFQQILRLRRKLSTRSVRLAD
jgi:hypothetical protein